MSKPRFQDIDSVIGYIDRHGIVHSSVQLLTCDDLDQIHSVKFEYMTRSLLEWRYDPVSDVVTWTYPDRPDDSHRMLVRANLAMIIDDTRNYL
jgi:hypothetical protein